MKRGYTALEYKSIVRRLRKVRPGVSLSSDFIIGFPGETEADFEATMKLIDEVDFDGGFSFVYSPRPGTPAADLEDVTPYEIKLHRLQRLQARVQEQQDEYSRRMLGTRQRVLGDKISRKNGDELAARTDNNRMVNFPGSSGLDRASFRVTIWN
jgi:tRNA-2-methylthio-N6-dimethylallyladenosine synthase